VLPHQVMERLNDLLEGYELLRNEFSSPRVVLSDLTKLHRLISQIEEGYGTVENFLKVIQRTQKEVRAMSKSNSQG